MTYLFSARDTLRSHMLAISVPNTEEILGNLSDKEVQTIVSELTIKKKLKSYVDYATDL